MNEPSAATTISVTTASRSSPGFSDVRSVDKRSGSIGNTFAEVYTDVVLNRACASMAEPFLTSASTSATATWILTAPSASLSQAVN